MSAPAKDREERKVEERCFLCDAPWTDDHPRTCPEWPKEARDA